MVLRNIEYRAISIVHCSECTYLQYGPLSSSSANLDCGATLPD